MIEMPNPPEKWQARMPDPDSAIRRIENCRLQISENISIQYFKNKMRKNLKK